MLGDTDHKTGKVQDREAWAGVSTGRPGHVLAGEFDLLRGKQGLYRVKTEYLGNVLVLWHSLNIFHIFDGKLTSFTSIVSKSDDSECLRLPLMPRSGWAPLVASGDQGSASPDPHQLSQSVQVRNTDSG